jgi:hypothetical protein
MGVRLDRAHLSCVFPGNKSATTASCALRFSVVTAAYTYRASCESKSHRLELEYTLEDIEGNRDAHWQLGL